MPHTTPAGAPVHGELDALLEAEARFDERLAAATRRAAAIVETARAEAAARRAQIQAALTVEERALVDALLTERERAVREIRERAAHERTRFDDVPEDLVVKLAEDVIAALIATDGSS